MRIKIGLLLDAMRVPQWQQHILAFIKNNPSFTLQLVVVNAAPKSSAGKWVYKFFRKLDRAVFPVRQDCFNRVPVQELLQGIKTIKVQPIQRQYTDEFPSAEVEEVKRHELDVIIRFGFRILKGDILNAAKHGVWSLHHGDNAVNRGGPPAFWEVVNKEPVTGVTLQKITHELDGGVVIDKAFTRTDRTSFNRNQNALYWAGIELMCSSLEVLAHNLRQAQPYHRDAPLVNKVFYSKPLYRDPGNAKVLRIFSVFWIRRLKESVRLVFRKQQWSLYYHWSKKASIETSLYRYKKLSPPAGTEWADPFVVKRDKHYYVFFEENIFQNKKAHLSCFVFDEQGKLTSSQPLPILTEPYHLSYPFIFEQGERYYLLPEAAACGSVWLYRCEKFPGEWKRYKQLLPDIALYDPTLVQHQNTWYLFGTQKPLAGSSADQYLCIYFSNDLFSESWQAHPKNPVTRDVRGARPAGRIFERDGKLIRPGQLGAPKYGYGIRFHEITKLSPTEFEENAIADILPEWQEDLLATHTFNFVDGFSVVDVQQ